MANYISALNGEQMDAALTDVALHNSEAWAVGTRNTIPVSSSDETYHNNAKYYAQVAQSAIPGTYTAAVRWDIAQGLAGEAQEQARANISAGASNRNLLDNPFFTVNQRGFTSSTGSNGVYTVDRWKINNGGGTGGTVSVTSQGYIQLTTGSAYVSFQQMFGGNELAGKTVTMSVNDNGTISSHSFTVPTRGSSDVRAGTFVFKTGCSCHFFVMNTSAAYGYNFQLSIGQGYSATIRAVKLELGSYSTLANDVLPDYGEEFGKCITSTADPTDPYANTGFGRSNRNLLDNPWWGSGEVVNQRSVTAKPSSNGAYCIDRWTWNSGADANNMSLGANGITFTRSASNIWFAQKMANPSALVGKTITGSVMLSNGTIKSGSVVYASVGSTPTLYEDSAVQIYISSAGAFSLTIKTTQTIRAVKLELGSYSTLANDVPQNDELECLKYQELIQNVAYNYIPIGFGAFAGGNTIRMFIPTSVPMNAASLHASVPITGAASVAGNGTTISVASITLVGVLRTGVYVNVNLNSAPTTGHTYSLMLGDGASILIDCNL